MEFSTLTDLLAIFALLITTVESSTKGNNYWVQLFRNPFLTSKTRSEFTTCFLRPGIASVNMRITHSKRMENANGTFQTQRNISFPNFSSDYENNVSVAKYFVLFPVPRSHNAVNSLTVSYFTHRRCFRGIWFFRFVARHQVSVCRNILNQLQQSRAWVRTRPHMDGVVRHAQFDLGMTLNTITNDTIEGFGWCNFKGKFSVKS